MKFCVAQTKPVSGDILSNVRTHSTLVDLAVSDGAELIVFPELSLTGYEPALAKELAITPDDTRLDALQASSDAGNATIGVGAPTKTDGSGICISLVLFQPRAARQVYSKVYLHPDEEDNFVPGIHPVGILGKERVSLAICYELSVPEHARRAHENGANIYIASSAKSLGQAMGAIQRMSEIARQYSMTTAMSNCIGRSDGMECAGRSSVWGANGFLLDQIDGEREGIIVYDTDTNGVSQRTI